MSVEQIMLGKMYLHVEEKSKYLSLTLHKDQTKMDQRSLCESIGNCYRKTYIKYLKICSQALPSPSSASRMPT